jgi:hypothetical protein
MLFGKNAELDRMFKETGHQNAYFHYLFQRACLKQKKNAEDFERMCYRNTL